MGFSFFFSKTIFSPLNPIRFIQLLSSFISLLLTTWISYLIRFISEPYYSLYYVHLPLFILFFILRLMHFEKVAYLFGYCSSDYLLCHSLLIFLCCSCVFMFVLLASLLFVLACIILFLFYFNFHFYVHAIYKEHLF